MTLRRPFALVLLLATLALAAVPPIAFAQSAGDDQYQDPLGPGGGGGGDSDPAPSTPPSGSGGSTQTPAPSAGAAQAPSTDAAPSQGSAGSSSNVPLARTGFDALIPAIAGLLLLAGGTALLLGPRRRARRH